MGYPLPKEVALNGPFQPMRFEATVEECIARAFLGITVPDYPNFFIINGPNTNAGHGGSAIHGTEFQVRYIMQMLKYVLPHGVTDVAPKLERYAAYNQDLDDALSRKHLVHEEMFDV